MNDPYEFWAGAEGDEYARRNSDSALNGHGARRKMLSCALAPVAVTPESVLEFGAGDGANLAALREIMPTVHLGATEINGNRIARLRGICREVWQESITDGWQHEQFDVAFTRGVLIHVPPAQLPAAYDTLYAAARRYILIAEYFSPRLEEIPYHGRSGLLWKGPHAYQMLDTLPDVKLVSYGFVSSRDWRYPQDDLTWWLLSKV